MADTKTTGLDANTSPLGTDIVYLVDDPGGSPASQKMTLAILKGFVLDALPASGRLTLETGVPVSTADQSAKTTLYYTPYKGDLIALFNGATWDILTFTELSLNISAFTASKPYDIFCYNNSGTAALEGLIWTDGTNRATALAYQNGVLCKTGALTRRYLGTIYINSSGGQTDDAVTKRFVWNYYHRVEKNMYKSDTTSHNYTTNTERNWNNDAANRVEFVIGVSENVNRIALTTDHETSYAYVSFDASTFPTGALAGMTASNLTTALVRAGVSASHFPGIGYHYYQIGEFGVSGATQSLVHMSATINC